MFLAAMRTSSVVGPDGLCVLRTSVFKSVVRLVTLAESRTGSSVKPEEKSIHFGLFHFTSVQWDLAI